MWASVAAHRGRDAVDVADNYSTNRAWSPQAAACGEKHPSELRRCDRSTNGLQGQYLPGRTDPLTRATELARVEHTVPFADDAGASAGGVPPRSSPRGLLGAARVRRLTLGVLIRMLIAWPLPEPRTCGISTGSV